MSSELTGLKAKMEELIQMYGRQIREVGFSQHLAKQKDHLAEEKDHISNKFYKSLRRDKALNQGTTRDRDTSYSRPEGERNNLKRVGLFKLVVRTRHGRTSAEAILA